jgi:DNA-binding transcriptional MerR regulator
MLNRQNLLIGAMAERTGCTVPTIRYYEEIGLLPKAGRTPGGRRVYGEPDFRQLLFIRRCRDFGFSIEQVRALASLTESADRDCYGARDLVQSHLEVVREKLVELKALEQSLAGFVESCNTACAGGAAANCVILEDLASSKPSKRCG